MAHSNLVKPSRSNHKMNLFTKESAVKNTYQYVINDTLSSLKEIFMEEGIDAQVIENLKELWESKLKTSKVCEDKKPPIKEIKPKPATAVQIVIPSNTKPPAKLVVNVPSSVVANNQLSKMFSGSVLQSVLDLPHSTAQAVIQEHVNKFLEMNKGSISQVDGSSSSDEDLSSKEDSDEHLEFIGSEEVLNSDDDLTDEGTDFEGDDNLIVCQYEKVMKTKGHWKFIFKDGVMNLNGKEYVFKRAVGEAMW